MSCGITHFLERVGCENEAFFFGGGGLIQGHTVKTIEHCPHCIYIVLKHSLLNPMCICTDPALLVCAPASQENQLSIVLL